MSGISRRPPPPLGDLGQAQWNAIRGPLYRFLKWMVQEFSGIPGGFKNRTPEVVQVGGTGAPGSEQDGWMSAGAQLVTATGSPVGLGSANAEGTSSAAPRLDHVHKRSVEALENHAGGGIEGKLDFIDTVTVAWTITDNPGSDRVEIEADVSGGFAVSPLTTKGDIWGFSTVDDRIPVGADGEVLTADSGAALGVSWQPSSSGYDLADLEYLSWVL